MTILSTSSSSDLVAPHLRLGQNTAFEKIAVFSLYLVGLPMIFDLSLGALMGLGLGIYLLYALIHPEKF